MTQEELNKKLEENTAGIFSKITALFKKHGVIKALILKTADDQNLDFGEEVQEASQIVVGSPATVGGAPAEGDYLMPDGSTYVFESGKVKEIKPAAPEPEDNLKEENEELKAQLSEAHELIKGLKKDVEDFKASITSDIKGLKPETPAGEEPVIRKPFKN